MKIVWIKTHTYFCFNCDKQFDWDDESCRWGKPEYGTESERRNNERIFCCDKCFKEYNNMK